MLFLLFRIGTERYALDANQVVEVVPLVRVKKIPQSPVGLAGVINYRGLPVPVIDLSELALGQPAQVRVSTRIILVKYPAESGEAHTLGLMAEQPTETMKREPADFVCPGVAVSSAPYLGRVANDSRGMIQWIEVKNLLPTSIRRLIFAPSTDPLPCP